MVRDGRPGRDGRDGKDADPALIEEMVARAIHDMPVLARGIPGRDGKDGKDGRHGKDADIELLRTEVERALRQVEAPAGPRGPEGPQGEIGPMPKHEWRGTELRFEKAPGKWGEFVNLRGPQGYGGGVSVVSGPGSSANSYFPAGW